MSGGGNNGKLKLGAKLTHEPAEVYKGAGALKIAEHISQQFRVEPFDRMNRYQDHTIAFWIYFFEGFSSRSCAIDRQEKTPMKRKT